MRTIVQKHGSDCGQVAVYNLVKLLGIPMPGGYEKHRRRIQRRCGYEPGEGCQNSTNIEGARLEIKKAGYKLVSRRPNWQNIINQLHETPRRGRVAVGILTFRVLDAKHSHICPIYMNANLLGIWGANFSSLEKWSLLLARGDNKWWPINTCPEDDKLVSFYQVQKESAA